MMNNGPHVFGKVRPLQSKLVLICGHFLGQGKEGQWLKRRTVAKVIERVRARYEVQDVEFGKVYKWRPERIVVECQCGQRLSLSASTTTSCVECGTDHGLAVKEESANGYQSDQSLHPWRYYYLEDREDAACLSEMRHRTFLA
jgi:hypothetical protein